MAENQGLHEDISREARIQGSSDRSFGLVFAVVFAIIGAVKLWVGNPLWPWWLAGAAVAAALALLRPAWLSLLNLLWMKLGLLLFKLLNPLVMALMFFVVVTPIGVLLRICKKDILRLRIDRAAPSYWIPREPPGPAPETMKNQF